MAVGPDASAFIQDVMWKGAQYENKHEIIEPFLDKDRGL